MRFLAAKEAYANRLIGIMDDHAIPLGANGSGKSFRGVFYRANYKANVVESRAWFPSKGD